MARFDAQRFYGLALIFAKWRSTFRQSRIVGDPMFAKPIYEISEADRRQLASELDLLATECAKIGLASSVDNARSISSTLLSAESVTNTCAYTQLDNEQKIIFSEMGRALFLLVPSERARFYEVPTQNWEKVIEKLPNTKADIIEANLCFACDRYAAAVYHTMLAVESGVVTIGKLLEINDPKLGWNSVLREIERIVHKSKFPEFTAAEQKYYQLVQQLLPLLQSMKDSWRHKISHVDNKVVLVSDEFDARVAEEIIFAARAFLRRLASEL